MVNRILLTSLIAALALFSSACSMKRFATIRPTETPSLARLDAIVSDGIKEKVYPGAVLIVGQPGKTLWAKAYGTKTYEPNSDPLTLDSIFDLASISKVVGTTSAALVLMGDGKLSPDDPVSEYIAGFDANGKEGDTVRDLMTHVSGLKAYENKDVVEKERGADQTHADALITHYAALPASYPPRSKTVYSCLNFQTTARVTENIAGMPMKDFLQQRVYGPLQMNDTTYNLTPEQLKRTVPTILEKDGSLLVGRVHDPLASYHGSEAHCPGNAGLFSSARDVARYCEMILNGGELNGVRVFDPQILEQATVNQSPEGIGEERGLGWDIYENPPYVTALNKTAETAVIGHTGYTGTLIWLDKKTNTYLVFFTNRVFPDDAEKKGGQMSITTVRKAVCDAVLRAQPVYAAYFAEADAKKATPAN